MTDQEIQDYFAGEPCGSPTVVRKPNGIHLAFPDTVRHDGCGLVVSAWIGDNREAGPDMIRAMRNEAVREIAEAAK